MSKIKLKPCPFCGGEAEMFGNESVVFVGCKECTCITEWYDDGEHKGVMVKEERGEHVLKTLFDELDEGYLGMCELKAYEDTGLTPEQIMELKERDTAMEINEIHVDEYYCPACGAENNCDQGVVEDNFCPRCGQRFWEDE